MNAPDLPPLERWLAEQACRDCIVRAGAALDAGDYDAFTRHFTNDATLMRPNAAVLKGHDDILASYRAKAPGRRTHHLITNIVVDLQSSTTAYASSVVLLWSATTDKLAANRDDTATDAPYGLRADARQLLGEFEDRLEMQENDWLIKARTSRFVMFRDTPL